MVNLDTILAGYRKFLLWEEFTFATQPINWETKLWHLLLLVSKAIRSASNIWLVALINLSFILINILMDKISSDVHWVVIKLKTIQPIIVYSSINTQTMLEYLTESVQFHTLFILFLELQPAGKYRFNHL